MFHRAIVIERSRFFAAVTKAAEAPPTRSLHFHMLATSSPTSSVVLGTTFYTAALERPLAEAVAAAGKSLSVKCVPYNQLHTFLLNPHSLISDGEPTSVVMIVRVEDLIRTELISMGPSVISQGDQGARIFRERLEEFLNVLSRLSRVGLTVIICPPGRGAFDIQFLGNAVRVAEHRIAAELRRQRRHLVISWSEFEESADAKNCFNAPGDRLGHVPFSPAGLDALAKFIVGRLDRMPSTVLSSREEASGRADLAQFLESLQLEIEVAPLTADAEELAINLVRHTTHFINVPGSKWAPGDMRRSSEAWSVQARDRYGDYGLCGALTFEVHDNTLRVGLLFITCPVLGRQVEYALFAWLADLAEQRGLEFIDVPFVRGRDNEALQALLGRLGSDSGTSNANIHGSGGNSYRIVVRGLAKAAIDQAPNPAAVRNTVTKLLGHKNPSEVV